ncbi:MAG TPA: M67 family metallopeptidase [Thermoanaerobaculia bacterium]|nr:M67 family metallopeptidase [Thermoanaerobaculia bacterium]
MSRLFITPRHLQTIERHASISYPDECCGVLIGRCHSGATFVERVLSVGNERSDSRHNRYLISPETVLAAHREARALGLDVIGYYHSHPDHPARPSDFDREHAWPGVSYLIVSVEQRKVADTRCWRLLDDRESFDEEVIDQAAIGASPPAGFPGVHKEAV